MNAIEMLHNRVSAPVLMAPAPSPEQLDVMFRAALRAPDHAGLRPWRFLVIEGEAREHLGDLFVKAMRAKELELTDESAGKLRKKPLRAPMIIVAVAKIQQHPKVPEIEQVITAGCATQALLQGAYAQGLGAMWRTGEMTFDPVVKAGLGLQAHEQVVGFIYLGTTKRMRQISDSKLESDLESIVSDWQGVASNNVETNQVSSE
ncbi:nitroreductase family protein [Neptunomonas antarctica]|uniref:Putative NAD(P)H nitroreductase n=1 Tax=Neptunomonas antarctica TaxID=619304 RepID=A0A1N7M6F5_9GAMM|nr:nitroreductase family protein [Neptunomonas antarctica]SIS81664.1 Nitroreductase [Neptunomonas antarctica]